MKRRDLLLLLALGAALALVLELTSHLGAPRSPGNLAARAKTYSEAAAGVAGWVVRGTRPPEGDEAMPERSLVLAHRDGFLELTFDTPTVIRGLLVQAEADDRYKIEATQNGTHWRRIGAVQPVTGPGLRTRSLTLGELPPLLGLRLRSASPGLSVLSAVRVYPELPEGWPAVAQGQTVGSWPWVQQMRPVLAWRFAIAALGLAGAVAFWRGRRRGAPSPAVRPLLAAAAVLALLSGWDFFQTARPVSYMWSLQNHWDVYHYYLGAKYSPELGYTELYSCTLAADVEAGLMPLRESGSPLRDLGSNALVPVSAAAAVAAEACHERFAPERWQAFTADVAWFRSQVPPVIWLQIARDHGYNPSPAWAVVGRPLAEAVPLGGPGFAVLMALDTVLLVMLWGIAWRTFGLPAAAAGLVYFGTNFAAGHWWTHGAFLRQGWLFLSVLGLCCLYRGRAGSAGFLLAWATLLRIFPAFFVIGVVLRVLADVSTQRSLKLAPERLRFVAGGLAAIVVIGGLSLVASGRLDAWQEFARNTEKHYDVSALNTMGALAVTTHIEARLGRGQEGLTAAGELKSGRIARNLRVGLALAVLPLLFLAVRREPDWAAAILATAWIPFVTELGSYYYALIAVCAFLTVRRDAVAIGVTSLALVMAGLGIWDDARHLRATFVTSSACILLFDLWLLGAFAFSRERKQDAPI